MTKITGFAQDTASNTDKSVATSNGSTTMTVEIIENH